MKIGVFTDSYRPYTSGVVRSIDLFTKEFTQRGHEVYIFGPDYPLSNPPKEDKVFRFAALPAPTMPDFSIPLPISAQFSPTIKKIGLDVIHVHTPFILGSLGARAARRHRLPLVFTFHTLYDQYVHYVPFVEEASRQIVQLISRDFCNRCNMVVAPSQLVVNYLRRIGVESQIVNIPTGIELDEFTDLNSGWLKENYAISEDKTILLFVGRLGKEKNVIFLMKSFKEIHRLQPDTHLVLVGKGPQEEALKKFCRLNGLNDSVTFTGVLPRQLIVHCYASADLFVFPSVTETQGLVIGEAKAAGLPVVAVRAYGPAEIVAHGVDGLLTDPTLNSFTDAILTLLADPEQRKQMSQAAVNNAQSISSAYCAEQILEIYEGLIADQCFAPRRFEQYSKRFKFMDF
jgi:1,2-diacylglycerol 3-alpha-glucosyltransferase